MATEPDKKLLDDPSTLTIKLDGKSWPVPKLAPKQNKIVVPLILELTPRITEAMRSVKKPAEGADRDVVGEFMESYLTALQKVMTERDMTNLYTIVYWALERGHKGLSREEFDDMPIGALEAVEAVTVITKQTGVFRTKPQGAANSSGEAQAAA